ELMLFGPGGLLEKNKAAADFRGMMALEGIANIATRFNVPLKIIQRLCKCPNGPPYNPVLWNTPPALSQNNCYNYACNMMTNTFAQPGRACGHMYTGLQCAPVRAAAVCDGLLDAPTNNNKCDKK